MQKSSKKWLNLQFDDEPLKSNPAPKNASLGRPGKKRLSPAVNNHTTFNFHQHLAPKTVADLAVHSKKVKEVEVWLETNVCKGTNKYARFLLITGPTGSGKTVTVQVLCKQLGIDVSEWVSPVDQDFEVFRGPNQTNKFIEFLTESKYTSLFCNNAKKVVLVEDFPNTFLRSPEEFARVLEECFYKASLAVIFICTDTFDRKINLAEKLFTPELRNQFKIQEICFNACATTLIKNALKRAQSLTQAHSDLFKTPSQSTVSAIINTSQGDLKSAINQYYFASLLGTKELPTETSKVPGSKRKRNDDTALKTMTRDETLGLFHGIGRVLNPKRVEKGTGWRLNCDLDKLIDEFGSQPTSFTNFLFENYCKYFGDIDDACQAADGLSVSQVFLEKWVDRGDVLVYALWVAALGLMVHNEHRVSKWTPITGPKKIERRNSSLRREHATDLYFCNVINHVKNEQFVMK